MRKLILTAMIAGLLAPAGLHAQKVYAEGDKAILDLTVEAGMPAGAITSTSKTAKYKNATPGTGTVIANNDHNGTINATVYRKLEIALYDMNDVGEIGTSSTDFEMDWVTAFDGCIGSGYDNGEWRLPTQRELMLIYIFQPALDDVIAKLGGTAFSLRGSYWSATEEDVNFSWHVGFFQGFTGGYSKTTTGPVRCVREL